MAAHWRSGRHERHAYYVLRRLEADVFPEIGSFPLGELATSAFRNAVQKIERRGALDIAKRVLQTCGQINHALYLKPRAQMMQAWADHLALLRKDADDKGESLAA